MAPYYPQMPKDAFTLSDVRDSTLTIACEPCGRRGRYSIAKLIERHGDAKLIDLRLTIANCPKAQSFNFYDRCKVRYEGLATR